MKTQPLTSKRQQEILDLLANGPMLGKQIAIEVGVTQPCISYGLQDLCRAGLVAKGYSLTPKGRLRVKREAK